MIKFKIIFRLISGVAISMFTISCGRPNPNPIDVKQVDSVIIYYHFPDDTISPPPRKLLKESIKDFVERWNNEYPADHCKFYPNYLLTVYLQGGEERKFRAVGQEIKEKTDECFNFGKEDYFGELWKANH